MVEREWTRQSGELAKIFKMAGLVWISFKDSGRRQFNKIGCDGIVSVGATSFTFCEVKIAKEKLTENEQTFAKQIEDQGLNLRVLRIFPDKFQVTVIEKGTEVFWPNDLWCEKIQKALQ
jgi:hypothetical protein